jgi:LysR family transcriptional regulator for bpeEF and oprC
MVQLPRTRQVAGLLDSGALVPLLGDWSCGSLPLVVMYPRQRHLSMRLRVFVDWVVELYRATFEALDAGPRPAASGLKRTSKRNARAA